jgi:ABC-type antimicrobial peptide transport system permease subunit
LGAQPGVVFRMVTGRALRMVLVGVAFGLTGWWAVRRLLNALLFGISSGNPANLAAATALLVTIALCASWLPARRATQIDPASALREQ